MPFHIALLGGVLIGLSVTLMLLLNGRVTGISNIINHTFSANFNTPWRIFFLLGLFCGGAVMFLFDPTLFANQSGRSFVEIAGAGFLVGFGATLAGGCTSGHGVCGVSRLSKRSILATTLFMLAGFASVYFLRQIGWAI